MYKIIFLITLATLTVEALPSASDPVCVPPEGTGFYYVSPCPDEKGPMKIVVSKITATQDNKLINEGIDTSIPLSLNFKISVNVPKISPAKHKFDQKIKQYISRKGDGGECKWYDIDLGDLLDDKPACDLVQQSDCHYTSRTTNVTAVIDFNEMMGGATSGLTVGTYYGFKITEKDGDSVLNCIWMQAKVTK